MKNSYHKLFFFYRKEKEIQKSTVAFSVNCGIGARSHCTKIDTQKHKTKGRRKKKEEFFSFT